MDLIREFEEKIGYSFDDKALIEQALTHSSYANEHRLTAYNERPEFLGDAVLELVSSDYLYTRYPQLPEGKLTKLRASLVCEPALAYDAMELGLGKYLRLSKGEDATGGRTRKSVLSDALEAVIGAIYLDAGLDMARAFIMQYVLNDIEKKTLFNDSKSILQERIQAVSKGVPEYRLDNATGPDHCRTYFVSVYFEGKKIGEGSGATKKAAEQDAAYHALLSM